MFTRIDSHSHIEFAPTLWLMRAFLPRMLFRIEAAGPAVCRVVAEIHLRMGPLAARGGSLLAPLGLGFALVMLVGAVATRLEAVPQEGNASPD